jgi:hypothetical protein
MGVHSESVLRSHCIDEKCMDLLARGSFDAFLLRRADLVGKAIADHVQSMALWGFADGPEPEAWFDDMWGGTSDAA